MDAAIIGAGGFNQSLAENLNRLTETLKQMEVDVVPSMVISQPSGLGYLDFDYHWYRVFDELDQLLENFRALLASIQHFEQRAAKRSPSVGARMRALLRNTYRNTVPRRSSWHSANRDFG